MRVNEVVVCLFVGNCIGVDRRCGWKTAEPHHVGALVVPFNALDRHNVRMTRWPIYMMESSRKQAGTNQELVPPTAPAPACMAHPFSLLHDHEPLELRVGSHPANG